MSESSFRGLGSGTSFVPKDSNPLGLKERGCTCSTTAALGAMLAGGTTDCARFTTRPALPNGNVKRNKNV